MGTISVSLPIDGTTADVADYNTPITTIVNEINGNLDNSNLAAGAAIAGSKLADGGLVTAKYADGSVTSEKLDATIACRAYRSGAQTIEVGTEKVLLETENFDLGSDFDTSNNRFVAPVTGYYHVIGNAGLTNLNAVSDQVLIFIYVNGAEVAKNNSFAASAGDDPLVHICDTVFVTAGQYIELYIQNATSATESLRNGTTESYMSIYFLGV